MYERLLPAAITPVSLTDVLLAAVEHARGYGLQAFEKRLAEYFSARASYTFGSLMRTNYACLTALSQGSMRKKVVLPRYSCPSFVHAVIAAELEVQYCDIDPGTLALDVSQLRAMDLSNTLAIICTNLFGLTNPIDQVVELGRKRGVFVIEGVDYGIGTIYRSKRIGTFGDVAILNFQEGKVVPVGGGALVTNNDKIIARFLGTRNAQRANFMTMLGFSVCTRPALYAIFMKLVGALGMNKKAFSMEDTIRNTNKETDFFFNAGDCEKALSNFQGALGCQLLSRLDSDMAKRKEIASALIARLRDIPGIELIEEIPGVQAVHYVRLPVLVGMGKRGLLLGKLFDAGIEASPMYIEHGMVVEKARYPGSYRVAHELLTLPCHPFVDSADVEKIIAVVKAVMSERNPMR